MLYLTKRLRLLMYPYKIRLLNCYVKLQKEKNLTYLFVAHDIALIRSICHRVVVMYNGEVVEAISAKHLTEAKHPYTRSC